MAVKTVSAGIVTSPFPCDLWEQEKSQTPHGEAQQPGGSQAGGPFLAPIGHPLVAKGNVLI